FSAALSFLRREEPVTTYHDITRRAGELAAVWTFEELSWSRKRWLKLLPTRLRMRAALRLSREIARAAYPGSKIVFRMQRDGGQVEVRGSVFCQVREKVERPLCGFYEGVIVKLMELIDVRATINLASCRAVTVAAAAAVFLTPIPASAQSAVGSTRIIVMPFETTERDPRLVWLSEASAVLISENLRTYGFAALSREERVRAFHDLNLPPDASLSEASIIQVGQLVGASDVITGTLRLSATD